MRSLGKIRKIVPLSLLVAICLTLLILIGGVTEVYADDSQGIIKWNSENGRYEYYENGRPNYGFKGIAVSQKDGNNYYVERGVVNFNFTGISRNPLTGNWEYVRRGKALPAYTGIAKSSYDGKYYFVRDGIWDRSFTGVAWNPDTKSWNYVRNGKEYSNYTGIAVSSYDGNNYFVRDGKVDFTYTGLSYNPATGTWDYTRNGKANYNFEGAAKSIKTGEYYYAKNGRVDFTFTGLAKSADHGTYIYTKNGRHRPEYTGPSTSMRTEKYYHVIDGIWLKNSGEYKYGVNTYTYKRGTIVSSLINVNGKDIGVASDGTYSYYSNSSLASGFTEAKYYESRKGTAIKKITIHHMSGIMTAEECGNYFHNIDRRASSNYGVGSDGKIWQYVDEKYRSRASANDDNDMQAVTIETSNSAIGGDWPVSDKSIELLIELCTDICKRNGIEKLNFTGDETGNLTMHKYFMATDCPGPYLSSKFPYIAREVNKRLES